MHRKGLMKITKPVASKKCIALEEGRQIGREGLVAYRTYHTKRISKRSSVLKLRAGCYNYRFKHYKWLPKQ